MSNHNINQKVPHQNIGGVEHKQCPQCLEWKTLDNYGFKYARWDKLSALCKPCEKKQRDDYISKNIETYKNIKKRFKENNPKYNKNYYVKNFDRLRDQHRKYYLSNKEKCNKASKEYQKKHAKRLYQIKMSNPMNRIVSNLRVRMVDFVKGKNPKGHMKDLIGCSLEHFRKHLQDNFQEGMTWKNYGKGKDKWSIDHTIPCYNFDLIKIEEQKKCFNFTNLKPMWYVDNCRKQHRTKD